MSPLGASSVLPLTEDKVEELKRNNILKSIDQFDTNEKIYFAPKAVDALAKARLINLRLSVQHLTKGILACGFCTRDLKTFDLAFWAFDILKSENAGTVEAFESMMNICSKYGRVDKSVDLMRDFFAHGHTYTSYLLSTYIIILANNGTPMQVKDLLYPLYTTYRVSQQLIDDFSLLLLPQDLTWTIPLYVTGFVKAKAI